MPAITYEQLRARLEELLPGEVYVWLLAGEQEEMLGDLRHGRAELLADQETINVAFDYGTFSLERGHITRIDDLGPDPDEGELCVRVAFGPLTLHFGFSDYYTPEG